MSTTVELLAANECYERLRAAVEEIDDAICDALMAARIGKYDGMNVEVHLQHLIERVRKVTA